LRHFHCVCDHKPLRSHCHSIRIPDNENTNYSRQTYFKILTRDVNLLRTTALKIPQKIYGSARKSAHREGAMYRDKQAFKINTQLRKGPRQMRGGAERPRTLETFKTRKPAYTTSLARFGHRWQRSEKP
jgi:hypothetical protein